MDETPMRFELHSSRSLEFTGSRTVPVNTCGAEKRSFTIALAVAADGTKLPPKVIFKGVRPCSAEFSARFLPQKGMVGRARREGVDSPVFAENP